MGQSSDGCRRLQWMSGLSMHALSAVLLALLLNLRRAQAQDTSSNSETTEGSEYYGIDFILLHGFLVFFMQVGFIQVEVGYGRTKNIKNILLKNTVDVLISALCWWSVGYAFAHGDTDKSGFIGTSRFFQESSPDDTKPWFFSWSFCISTVTIIGGCLAERTNLAAYPIITALVSLWVHPVAVHWVWTHGSWLQRVSRCHFLDFAGGTVVHCVGGLTGLVGAVVCGPRIGRFEDGRAKPMPGHDVSSVSLGVFMLWFGWYGFNVGSVYVFTRAASSIVDRVAINMTLCAATAGLTALGLSSVRSGVLDLCTCVNGVLCGLVASTPTSGYVAPWAGAVIGVFAGAVYVGLSRALVRLGIDDPLDSSVIHLGGGLLGTVLNGALARPEYARAVALGGDTEHACGGFVYGPGANGGTQLGMQLLGSVVVCGWAALFACVVFLGLARARLLRVDQATELAGIDNIDHGGPAYPEFNLVNVNASRAA